MTTHQAKQVKQHFVTFFSPGTFVHETTTKPISAWDVDEAMSMADSIVERYGAKPFGFKFSTRSRGAEDLDSKITQKSGMYYLGGKIETIDDVAKRKDPKETILLSNMRCNNIKRVIVNTNSYKSTNEFNDGDTLLDWPSRATSGAD